MAEILFITTRNILNTSGELRLIKNRNKVLYDNWGIKTDFIVLASEKKIINSNEKIEESNEIKSITINNYNPFSIFISLKRCKEMITDKLKNNEYKIIILSGIGTLSLISHIRKINNFIPIITDVHGAKEELIEFPSGNLIKKTYQRFLFIYSNYTEKKLYKEVNAALVVSQALGNYISTEYNINKYVIPCSVQNYEVNTDKKNIDRRKYRNKYNIKDDEILFIYSGGVSPWQCIDKTVEIFLKVKTNIGKKSRLLILSHNMEVVKKMFSKHKDIIIDSVDSQYVNNVLSAGDYAFLIRDNLVTNNVAYPNKFLEYVQSGMKIITTPNVFDIAEQVQMYNLGIVIDLENNYEEELIEYILSKKVGGNRQTLIENVSFSNTLKDFVDDFHLDTINEWEKDCGYKTKYN